MRIMNRRYTLLFLVALATTASGQNQRLRQLEECLQKQGYKFGYSQSNIEGRIRYYWSGQVNALGSLKISRPDDVKAQLRQRFEQALDSIRVAFIDLSKEATESYQYEFHQNEADTIEYSVGFKPSRGNVRSKQDNNKLIFMDAKEAASYTYKKNCDDWDSGAYIHWYLERNSVSWNDMRALDVEAFEAYIQPAFAPLKKLKGANVYPIYWRHDEGYEDDFNGGIHMKFGDNANHTGLITGTHYFIPAQYKAEANALFLQLDSLALDYLNHHPEQLYTYFYSPNLPYAKSPTGELFVDPNADIASFMVQAEGKTIETDAYYLHRYRYDDGLHIISIVVKGEGWMPKEWTKLKSWINGEKVYLKGMEPKKSKK